MIDQHMHTKYSPDSVAKIEDYLAKSKEYGTEYINITDHLDLTKNLKQEPIINFDNVFKDLAKYNNIKVGIEIGYCNTTVKETIEFIKDYQFSLILLSVHANDEHGFNYGRFREKNFTPKQIVNMYYDQMAEAITSGIDFDIITHIGYIFRYSTVVNPYDYMDKIEEVLKLIVKHNKILEINTGCLRNRANDLYDFYSQVVALYVKNNGSQISFGSDAHKVEDYCNGYDRVVTMLKDNGINHLTIVKDRKYYSKEI